MPATQGLAKTWLRFLPLLHECERAHCFRYYKKESKTTNAKHCQHTNKILTLSRALTPSFIIDSLDFAEINKIILPLSNMNDDEEKVIGDEGITGCGLSQKPSNRLNALKHSKGFRKPYEIVFLIPASKNLRSRVEH